MHKLQPWLTKNIIALSLASTFSDTSHEVVPLVLPLLMSNLIGHEAAPIFIAFIGGLSTMLASIAGLFSGALSDRLSNRKPLIVGGYFIAGSLVGLIVYANSWITVCLLIVGAWIGRGLINAPRNGIIADSTDKNYYGRAFGFRQAFDTIGSILGPLIVYLLASWPPHAIFAITLLPASLACLVVHFFVQDTPQRHIEENFTLITRDFPKRFYYLMLPFLSFGCANFTKSLLILRVQEIFSQQYTLTATVSTVTLLYIFRNIVQACASYLMGIVSDRIGRLIPLAIAGFGFFGSMCFILTQDTLTPFLALSLFFLSGFSAGTTTSLQKALIADALPENLRGRGYGIIALGETTAALCASSLLGLIWRGYSAEIAFSIVGMLSFVSILTLIPLYQHIRSS